MMPLQSGRDRRQFPRRPKLLRFNLLWQKAEEKVFTTDVSLGGMFFRTAVVPPLGSSIVVILPEARPQSECVRIEAQVMRIVRPGDPANPLGGIGVALERMSCTRGTGPIADLLKVLLGDKAPEIPPQLGPVVVAMPSCQVEAAGGAPREPESLVEDEVSIAVAEPMTAEIAVFCRWRNMVIQATLRRLGQRHAVLGNLKVLPQPGDVVSVRMMSQKGLRFGGTEFTGQVDQIHYDKDSQESLVSLVLDAVQSDIGGIRSFIRKAERLAPGQDGPGTADET